MGRKPVLGLVGACLASVALSGCWGGGSNVKKPDKPPEGWKDDKQVPSGGGAGPGGRVGDINERPAGFQGQSGGAGGLPAAGGAGTGGFGAGGGTGTGGAGGRGPTGVGNPYPGSDPTGGRGPASGVGDGQGGLPPMDRSGTGGFGARPGSSGFSPIAPADGQARPRVQDFPAGGTGQTPGAALPPLDRGAGMPPPAPVPFASGDTMPAPSGTFSDMQKRAVPAAAPGGIAIPRLPPGAATD